MPPTGWPSRRASLLDAGLDLLGGRCRPVRVDGARRSAGRPAWPLVTSTKASADKDEFVAAVFDWVIADLAATTQAAVAAAPPDEQTRAAMANIVRTIAGDARIGRLLFSSQLANAVLVRKRVESSALFAMLSGQHVERHAAGAGRTTGSRPRRTSWSAAWGRRSAPGWPATYGSIPINWSTSWRRCSTSWPTRACTATDGRYARPGCGDRLDVFGTVCVSSP